jgi:hypothetical protein
MTLVICVLLFFRCYGRVCCVFSLSLYVCDEATACVDPEADRIIHDTLLALPATVLFVCHRLEVRPLLSCCHGLPCDACVCPQNLHRFDRVVVLAKGKVVAVGPYTPDVLRLIEGQQ